MAESPRAQLSEVQALRAFAVFAVVVYHLYPKALPGGYVGVDVFFAISGFLITGHLLREVEATGAVSLTGFWARRIRRLLPASTFVLLVSLGLVFLVLPESSWSQFAAEARAAALYIQNFHLARESVAYLAEDRLVSPFEHYWSLSVEEQFYLVWPILVLGASGLARGKKEFLLRTLTGLFGVMALSSLALSIVLTSSRPLEAYFWTPVRVHEFALGALLSLFTERASRVSEGVRGVLSWFGLALIAIPAFVFSGQSKFPGALALIPVFGTLLVIASGAPKGRFAPTRLYELRALQKAGDLSYSFYLWHMPLLVLLRAAFSKGGAWDKPLVLALAMGLAVLTKKFVEDPFRTERFRFVKFRWTLFAAMAGACATVALAVAAESFFSGESGSKKISPKTHPCFGARAKLEPARCLKEIPPGELLPTPGKAKSDRGWSTCMVERHDSEVKICETGVPSEKAKATVLLVGDSHAEHWLPALDTIAKTEGFHILRILKSACPFSDAVPDTEPRAKESCAEWNKGVHAELARHPEISWVFTSASAFNPFVSGAQGVPWQESGAQGYRSAWQRLPSNIEHVVVFRDLPRPRVDVVQCLEKLSPSEQLRPGSCGRKRREALLDDPLVRALEGVGDRVALADFSEVFCDETTCAPVHGHALVYRDKSHMTATFARTLAPFVSQKLATLRSASSARPH